MPLVEITRIGDAPPKPLATMRDLRVIDFTRVLAGPTCGRFLAEAGAQVTRIEHPQTPDLIAYKLDANRDKQECTLDLREPGDLARLQEMATRADVFVQAYRPGVAARFGLDPQTLCAANPGLICASLSAYGHEGPWSQRRGFDSVIQSACGLAAAHGGEAPKAAADIAAGLRRGFPARLRHRSRVHRRAREGGSYIVRTSLARVAHWLRGFQHEVCPAEDAARLDAAIAALSTETQTQLMGKNPSSAFGDDIRVNPLPEGEGGTQGAALSRGEGSTFVIPSCLLAEAFLPTGRRALWIVRSCEQTKR